MEKQFQKICSPARRIHLNPPIEHRVCSSKIENLAQIVKSMCWASASPRPVYVVEFPRVAGIRIAHILIVKTMEKTLILKGCNRADKSHGICRLAVYLPESQTVYFAAGTERKSLSRAEGSPTTLTAYFQLNAQCAQIFAGTSRQQYPIDARNLYCYQIPEFFTLHRNRCTPRDVERYSRRILLLNTKGKTSFEHIRTVDGTVYPTFSEAAKAAGFLDDDTYLWQSLLEVVVSDGCDYQKLLRMLAVLLRRKYCSGIMEQIRKPMCDDYLYQGMGMELAVTLAYYDILDRMSLLGKD
ncbi:hypothetical protein OSTOST_17424 [Ostertagia ostertagi]